MAQYQKGENSFKIKFKQTNFMNNKGYPGFCLPFIS